MALIAMAVYDPEDAKRSDLTYKTLASLSVRVDWDKHRLFVIDNGSCQETKDVIQWWLDHGEMYFTLITNACNVGTANAINMAWAHRRKGENAVKMDNDVVINHTGWVEDLEAAIHRDPTIGICGLKRKDLMEHPRHENEWFRSVLRMLPHEPGEAWIVVEEVKHVMGTCQMYSAALLRKIGYMYQMGSLYGFDDSLAAVRAAIAGFKCAFLPYINIDHIDPGGTDFTEWKQFVAGEWMGRFNRTRTEYESGARDIYYDGGEWVSAQKV